MGQSERVRRNANIKNLMSTRTPKEGLDLAHCSLLQATICLRAIKRVSQ